MANSIWCVGRNYADHAKEMKADIPKQPLIFLKAWGCINTSNTIKIPNFSSHLEHELELALKLDENLEPKELALALDLTARDVQTQLKQKGHPWALAKSFKDSCLLSQWIPFQNNSWFEQLEFQLQVNDQIKQTGKTQDMIFSVDALIHYLKENFPLQSGDIILTGTPAGVGPLKEGDQLKAQIMGELDWRTVVDSTGSSQDI